MIKKLFFIFVALALLVSSHTAQAVTTHNYTCSDFTNVTAGICSGSTITFANSAAQFAYDDLGTHFQLGSAVWYVSLTVTGGSGTGRILCAANVDACQVPNDAATHYTATVVDQVLDTRSDSSAGIYLRNDTDPSVGAKLAGTITNICITDTVGGCAVATTFANPILGLVRAFFLW